jgi:hypothetical protein
MKKLLHSFKPAAGLEVYNGMQTFHQTLRRALRYCQSTRIHKSFLRELKSNDKKLVTKDFPFRVTSALQSISKL